MSETTDGVTQVTESIDGAIMEEIGSPTGEHLEEVFIEGPDISFVDEGEILDAPEAAPEGVEIEEPVVETVESIEEVTATDPSEVSPTEPEEVTATPAAPTEGTEAASPTEVEPAREPFSLRMDGQTVEVPEAYTDGDNIVIPREQFQRVVQPRLADRNVWIEERRALTQQIEDLQPENNPAVVKANAMIDAIEAAFEDEETAYAFFQDFNANRGKLLVEAERAALEAERKQITSQQERANATQATAQLQQQVDTALSTVLEEAARLPAYSSVDWDYVRELIEPVKTSFFFRASEDMPQFGLRKGEVGVNIEKIEGVIKTVAARSQTASEASAAAQRNRAVLGEPSTEEPDPPAIEPDTPQVTTTPREITSREEWERHLAGVAAGR